jgi:hypothetical protein
MDWMASVVAVSTLSMRDDGFPYSQPIFNVMYVVAFNVLLKVIGSIANEYVMVCIKCFVLLGM